MRPWVMIVCVGVLLGLSASALASIVPHVGIAGARIGMTESQVRASLGKPRSALGNAASKELAYPTVTVVLVKGKVLGLTTKSPSEKVAGTIAVGSTEVKLRQKIKGLKCVVNFGTRVCNLLPPNRKVNQPFTEFVIDSGKVSRISIRTSTPLTQS